MSVQAEKQAFLVLVAQDKYNQSNRLIFADWLNEHGMDDEAEVQRAWTPEKQKAEDWLRDFAVQCGGTRGFEDEEEYYGPYQEITYEMVIQAGHDFVDSNGEDYFVQMGTETARSLMYEEGTREKFWEYWQLVTGVTVGEEKQGTVFSCSC
jgi:uncharacterized protein (TIGR02996 family)